MLLAIDRRLLARSRSVVEGRQRAIRQCPLDAALDRLMMYAKSLSHGKTTSSGRRAGCAAAFRDSQGSDSGILNRLEGAV